MLLALFEKLIDRVIELAREKERQRKRLYSEFVEPLMEEVEIIHEDYMKTARAYQASMDDSKPLDLQHPVFDLIEQDAVFSGSERARLSTAWQTLSEMKGDSPNLGRLLSAVLWYLQESVEPGIHPNAPRYTLLAAMEDVVESGVNSPMAPKPIFFIEQRAGGTEPKDLARFVIMQWVKGLQHRYGEVHKALQTLKVENS